MEISKSVAQMKSSYIREILAAATDPNMISLAGGLPAEETFPLKSFEPILAKMSSEPKIFQYGSTEGHLPLINYLKQMYHLPAEHSLAITTGSQQGLDLLARAYINPGDTIVMESPSYLGAMQVFDFVHANVLSVKQTQEGPDILELEEVFSNSLPKLFYAVPDFHNPTGVSWSLKVRKKVAELCIKYNVTLVEDAPYRDLRFIGENLPLVSEFCMQNSIVLRSFSKTVSPGLRVGVISGKASYISPIVKIKQGADLHTSLPIQYLLLGFLNSDSYPAHIINLKSIYSNRYDYLSSLLTAKLPPNCQFNPIEGGMFIWLELPQCDPMHIAKALMSNGVAVVPSNVFYHQSASVVPALRLNFTNSTPEDLEKAVDILSLTLHKEFTGSEIG
ncbi:PLP-dependent aminotransferase family protein [Marinomonas sp. TI.3.20]|uniref:aminotransferase-like domain-containing protein n=1 Tax=Marinomonas sp. TI.3.20 TaxID=3121296 RepID=UPI00311F4A20